MHVCIWKISQNSSDMFQGALGSTKFQTCLFFIACVIVQYLHICFMLTKSMLISYSTVSLQVYLFPIGMISFSMHLHEAGHQAYTSQFLHPVVLAKVGQLMKWSM